MIKSDLCDDLPAVLREIQNVALGADILATSRFDPLSCDKLLFYLKPGVTAFFIGSSGVGKSTLINQLARQKLLTTAVIRRDDDKGRHTTTRREMFVLSQGGIVIDTPGMRELGAESVDLSRSFADIDGMVSQCQFNDCTHTYEGRCAIMQALAGGVLDDRRFRNYQKLKRETRYDGLSSKQIEAEKIKAMFGSKGDMKKLKVFVKQKNKGRYRPGG